MERCALGCGRGARERHHVAGWANDRLLVVRLCPSCHRGATRGLRALGVDLRRGRGRGPAEVAHARAAGFAALLLIAVGPDPRIARALGAVERAASRVLGREVGPRPAEHGPFAPPPPTGRTDGLAGLLGAAPGEDPVRAFERYCRREVEGLR